MSLNDVFQAVKLTGPLKLTKQAKAEQPADAAQQGAPAPTPPSDKNQMSFTPTSRFQQATLKLDVVGQQAPTQDPVQLNQANAAQHLSDRVQDLLREKADLTKDLQNPTKKAEAQARMQLLDSQIKTLGDLTSKVEAYRRPENLSPEDAKTVSKLFGDIGQLTKTLSDPRTAFQTHAQETVLLELVKNPKLYDASAKPYPTKDPVVLNQANTVQHLSDRVLALMGEKANLTKDLQNPTKKAEAQARMQLLDSQIKTLGDITSKVEPYRRPENLSSEEAKTVASMLGRVDRLIGDLSDPTKRWNTLGQIDGLLFSIQHPGISAKQP
ncbi:MAG TPA: hypothetical protein V6D05_07580 [Stenomitos sp.]